MQNRDESFKNISWQQLCLHYTNVLCSDEVFFVLFFFSPEFRIMTQDFTRIESCAVHTLEWKRLQTATLLCGILEISSYFAKKNSLAKIQIFT